MNSSSGLLLLVLGVLAAAGCGHSPSWVRSLDASPSLCVYEGLPHQFREAELLEREQQRPDTTMIGGFHFYTPPVTVDGARTSPLKTVLGHGVRSFERDRVPSDCGPFHPDYAVQWTEGARTQQLLVCFTCNEVWWIGEGEPDEFGFTRMNELEVLLGEYALKRPKPE